eukprot:TRINITY_DN4268_c0_g1_i2.p1 TRINITY_DN4268_c0_g1~~TRINITY_DN4268_c0_g1_i2.p1  ORF type:complete len:179 (-),score=52.70 TRINITY_DN4268_c0_g1_i2:171-683(-)
MLPAYTSAFPPPPKYYKLYGGIAPQPEPPALPPDNATFAVFGEVRVANAQSLQQMFPAGQIDTVAELKKLNHSVAVNFLQLLDYLLTNPVDFQVKIGDIEQLVRNMNTLINTYRPHEARESLIAMMQDQVDRSHHSTDDLSKCARVTHNLTTSDKEGVGREGEAEGGAGL